MEESSYRTTRSVWHRYWASKKRKGRDSKPRPLEWQSSMLTARPRYSPTKGRIIMKLFLPEAADLIVNHTNCCSCKEFSSNLILRGQTFLEARQLRTYLCSCLLYISTIIQVLNTPNACQNMLFQFFHIFMQEFY